MLFPPRAGSGVVCARNNVFNLYRRYVCSEACACQQYHLAHLINFMYYLLFEQCLSTKT